MKRYRIKKETRGDGICIYTFQKRQPSKNWFWDWEDYSTGSDNLEFIQKLAEQVLEGERMRTIVKREIIQKW